MANFQYTNYLKEIFPNKSLQTIEDVIHMVCTETPQDNQEFQLENVINLLMESKEFTDNSSRDDVDDGDEELWDEARGEIRAVNNEDLSIYYDQLMNMFPDACPTYVTNLCFRKAKNFISLEALIDDLMQNDYPRKEIDSRRMFQQLQDMLPNADPSYLQQEADRLAYENETELKKFVEHAIDNSDYPTMETYLKNQKENEEVNRYTIDFNIQAFLKKFPDPEQYFSNPKRKCPLTRSESTEETIEEQENDEKYAMTFLYNYYHYLRKKDIDRVFRMCSKSLIKTCTKLDRIRKALQSPRKIIRLDATTKNISLLQEIAYLKNRIAIKRIIKECNLNYRLLKEEARNNGLLQTCACCFDEELIPEECYFCKNGCIFCKDCVKGGAETVIGDGKLDFPCLADCGSEFNIPTLQMVLESVVFSRMAQRKQIEEIKRANIDGLETCPFCDFATIQPPDSKIFKCRNDECMKESCLECKHISHIPLRCNEIEYDEDVKMRTYIENKMTEALLRTCWKCNKVFIKTSGCNKMTCSCGALMCYVCRKAVLDYTHFGDDGRCPLFTQDLNKFHRDAVLQGAVAAKVVLGVDKDPKLLKKDPSEGI